MDPYKKWTHIKNTQIRIHAHRRSQQQQQRLNQSINAAWIISLRDKSHKKGGRGESDRIKGGKHGVKNKRKQNSQIIRIIRKTTKG